MISISLTVLDQKNENLLCLLDLNLSSFRRFCNRSLVCSSLECIPKRTSVSLLILVSCQLIAPLLCLRSPAISTTSSPSAVSSWNYSDHHGKPSPLFTFCRHVSFQLLHVSRPSIFSLVALSSSFFLCMPASFLFPIHLIA